MTTLIISILGILVVILGFTTFNLLRKIEKIEDIILQYDRYISEFNNQIEASEKRLNEVDAKGMFKSDDEIGWFFEQIKVIQNGISQFKINQ
jgi:predicted PurR-regulated permease PerM